MNLKIHSKEIKPYLIEGMHYATEDDFRTDEGTLKLDLEYYEWIIGSRQYVIRITETQTDKAWLKTKIGLNLILVHNTPKMWNQKPTK